MVAELEYLFGTWNLYRHTGLLGSVQHGRIGGGQRGLCRQIEYIGRKRFQHSCHAADVILMWMSTDCGDQTGHACLFQIGDYLIGSGRQTCIHEHGFTAGHDQRTVALSHVDEMYGGLLLHGIGDDLLPKTHKQLVRDHQNGQDT